MARVEKQLWDGTKRLFDGPCSCGADTLYVEGVMDPDGRPQVYVFCDKCNFRQPMISRKPLSSADIAFGTKRARELGLAPACCTS